MAYWRFEKLQSPGSVSVVGEFKADLKIASPAGPRPVFYPDFDKNNQSLGLDEARAFLSVEDSGEMSPLDFGAGNSITLEAWVAPAIALPTGKMMYIVGKGRTSQKGFSSNNQNYALRLVGLNDGIGLSFLFRDENNSGEGSWHRWTSSGVLGSGEWHHVALTYTFGIGRSVRGYIDGKLTLGSWDMGGETDAAPVVDNDDLRIGASQANASGLPFNGRIDEVAIYRKALTEERIKGRFKSIRRVFILDRDKIPSDHVKVDIHEGIGESWSYAATEASSSFTAPVFGFPYLPIKYNTKALIVERSNPFLIRASIKLALPKGKHRLLLRARTMSRLLVDGKKIASTKLASKNASGHEEVPVIAESLGEDTRMLRAGMQEQLVTINSKGEEKVFLLEAFVGGKGIRPETGELSVSISSDDKSFNILSPKALLPLTDSGWERYTRNEQLRMFLLNKKTRARVGGVESKRWAKRHKEVRKVIGNAPSKPESKTSTIPSHNEVDDFINLRLSKAGRLPLPLTGDLSFLKRVALDTVGVVPSPAQIAQYENDKLKGRRSRAIDRFLSDNLGWADHWTSYWQDVLAENPNILKPMLNNTGPFRFWIHESFEDNKSMDRFVTELVMMEGSRNYGGAAGFGVATQNDVPMAAKAQIIGQAFLGKQMKCARCHDAPFHDFLQKDLFSIAAMLNKSPISVPSTSSVPLSNGARKPRVDVTLKPGKKVLPAWPFKKTSSEPLHGDSRTKLATHITNPENRQFGRVIVNRVWKRYLGWGLMEPVDDWSKGSPSHPELLEWLAWQFVNSGYDLKHIARIILNSHTYQRQVDVGFLSPGKPSERLFCGPARRRLTAEQLVDSLFAISGKSMGVEMLTLDVDGRRPVTTFLNLGNPRRAWEFTSLSNERDRPALAIPKAQSVVDVLKIFGWRDARQDPLTQRDHAPNVLQPTVLINGIVGLRVAQLSEDSAFTALALESIDVRNLVQKLYLRVLSRHPTKVESAFISEHIGRGYDLRVLKQKYSQPKRKKVHAVSWSNHLNAEATRIKQELEKRALEGDKPTSRIDHEWRARMEDVVFALINSPEFIFTP